MIKHLAGASVWSEDLNNLLPFYRDVLGLKIIHQSDRYVVLAGDASDAATLGLGSHSEVRGRNADPSRHMIGLESDDLRADWKRLKQAGVDFVEDVTDYGGLLLATLKDPEDNYVQIWQDVSGG